MHVKKHPHGKISEKLSHRPHLETHPHNKSGSMQSSQAVVAESTRHNLKADVLFFVDHAIAVTVSSVARKQAQRARLSVTGKSGSNLHITVSMTGDGDGSRFVAYNNDMCLFVGSSPTLYVVDHTARELEHSIYLYLSERLSGESAVTAQVVRETNSVFDLPILEGNSELGPGSLKARQNTMF